VKIPLSDLDISDLERRYVGEAMQSGWISYSGEFVRKAEEGFARWCGAGGCTLVSNGTAALHAALSAFGVGPGDEVIVPGLTFVSPAQCLARVGATPVFADVEETSWCIDPDEIGALVTPRTKGVIAVDVIGHPADYDRLEEVCSRHGLFLIEDAAEAHGSLYKGRRTGAFGRIATFSFFANKTLATGEGGAVVSNDARLLAKVKLLKNHGMSPEKPYWHEVVGDNLRATNLMAALLVGQLERAEELISRRSAVADRYEEALAAVPSLRPRPCAAWAEVVPWLVTFQLLPGSPLDRAALLARLRDAGIDARPLWHPLVDLPPYRDEARRRGTLTPRSRAILESSFWLPTSSRMPLEQVDFVAAEVRRALGSTP
jgi:perosamine synthetase